MPLRAASLRASPFAKGGRGDSTTRFAPYINRDSMTRFALYINKNSKAPLYAIQCCLFPAGVCFNPPAPFLKGEPTGRWPTGRRLFRRKFYAASRRVASRFPLCKGGGGGGIQRPASPYILTRIPNPRFTLFNAIYFLPGFVFNPPAPFLKGEPTGRWPTERRLFRRKFYAALRRVASRFPLCKGG